MNSNQSLAETITTSIKSHLIELKDSEFHAIRDLVYDKSGINLGEQKRSLIVGRLQKILRQNGLRNFKEYYDYVITDTSDSRITELLDRISTNHTFFWRENYHYEFFTETVLPYITKYLRSQNRNDIRIWCAGCSSGEEPYTLAMLVLEYFNNSIISWDIGILATDIADSVLKKAVVGNYDRENVLKMPPKLINNYFSEESDSSYTIKQVVKQIVTFKKLNLVTDDFPFKGKFQTIFCRNVMIYFDHPTRKELVINFSRFIEPEGYLIIGHSETLGRNVAEFTNLKPTIYRKVN
ncbi:MAG: protein-glutamate O-methyltransferase CheR [Calditrichaeota bacterium]|nr:protein-glutamate O-methyltransferase CheR [Calditrichota bacterium]